MKMDLPRVLLSLTLLVGLAGCASLPTPEAHLQPGANLAKYKTFALAEAQPGRFRDPEVALRWSSLLRNHLAGQMEQMGLRRVPAAEADLLIDLVATISTEVYVRPEYFYAERRISRWYARFPMQRMESLTTETADIGTLAVFAIDRAKDEPVWAGWLRGDYDQNPKQETVITALNSIVNQWPSKPAAK